MEGTGCEDKNTMTTSNLQNDGTIEGNNLSRTGNTILMEKIM
jgi:hypothetical protein